MYKVLGAATWKLWVNICMCVSVVVVLSFTADLVSLLALIFIVSIPIAWYFQPHCNNKHFDTSRNIEIVVFSFFFLFRIHVGIISNRREHILCLWFNCNAMIEHLYGSIKYGEQNIKRQPHHQLNVCRHRATTTTKKPKKAQNARRLKNVEMIHLLVLRFYYVVIVVVIVFFLSLFLLVLEWYI